MLPAYAGMIREFETYHDGFIGAPRVCGDDPNGIFTPFRRFLCSPRMRG